MQLSLLGVEVHFITAVRNVAVVPRGLYLQQAMDEGGAILVDRIVAIEAANELNPLERLIQQRAVGGPLMGEVLGGSRVVAGIQVCENQRHGSQKRENVDGA